MANKPSPHTLAQEYYIIDTKTRSCPRGRDWEMISVDKNKDYVDIKAKAKSGALAEEYNQLDNRICMRAENFHMPEHLTEECIIYAVDENGLVWIPKEDTASAQKALRDLKAVDPNITVSTFGLPIPAEEPKEAPKAASRSDLRRKLRGLPAKKQ